MYCQTCGRNAETRYVSYSQNIGVLVMRFGKSIRGYMCTDCASKYYYEYTLITLFAGWWGVISCIMTPIILIGNTASFCSRKGIVPADYHHPNQAFPMQAYNPALQGYPSPAQGYNPPPQAYEGQYQGYAVVTQENNPPQEKDESVAAPSHWDL